MTHLSNADTEITPEVEVKVLISELASQFSSLTSATDLQIF